MAPKTTLFIPHSRRNCRNLQSVRGALAGAGEPNGYGTPAFFDKIYREFPVNGLLRPVTARLTFLTKRYARFFAAALLAPVRYRARNFKSAPPATKFDP
jgi:hypothetical protein